MTRSTPLNRVDFIGTGTTGPFPFTFPVSDASHLVVIQTDLAGNETNPGYTVTGIGSASGGSITLTTALTSGFGLMIKRVVPLTQPTSIRNQAAFYPEIHENVFDRLTEIDQQQQEQINRALALPDNMSPVALPVPVSGSVLGWAGGAWAWLSGAAVTLASNLLTASAGMGTSLVNYLAPFTGAIGRLLNLKLAEQLSFADFGAVGDGTTTDTTAVQNAINAASSTGRRLIAEKGKTYLCTTLTPKSNVELDLQGSTIKLKASTFNLLIDGTGPSGNNFAIKNGTLDMNMAANANGTNLCGGGIWLSAWDSVKVENITCINAARDCLNFNACMNVIVENVACNNCGSVAQGTTFHGYGLEIQNGCYNVRVNNFFVNTMYGFGVYVHDSLTNNIHLTNLKFNGISFATPIAIAVTLTDAFNIRMDNVTIYNVSGEGVEVNGTTDCKITNVVCSTGGATAWLLVGQGTVTGTNPTGSNIRLTVDGFSTATTTGTVSAKLNYIQGCTFRGLSLDKNISVLNVATDRNNNIQDSTIVGTAQPSNSYGKFFLERVNFTDFYVERLAGNTGRFSNPMVSGYFAISVANAGITYIDLNAWNALGIGIVTGRVCVESFNPDSNSQATYQEALFAVGNLPVANISTPVVVSGNVARQITITTDVTSTNRRLVLTNSTGVALAVYWVVETVGR